MQQLLKILLINLLFFNAFDAMAESKQLLIIEYEGLDVKIPLREYDALSQIAKSMNKDEKMHILIKTMAYKEYAPVAHLRAIALKRAMEIRRIFSASNIDVSRIAIVVPDLESVKDNMLQLYREQK